MSKRVLLLGMYYSQEFNPSRGQGYRDRIRCEALENIGYIVDTLDNKHDELSAKEGRHCRANFADHKRMYKCMKNIWNIDDKIPRYDAIILDYFFSPAGWVNTRWTEKFFTETIPSFVQKNLLKENGAIWIPNNIYVGEMIMKHYDILYEYYAWSIIKDPELNPLYSSTDNVTEELLLCPDNITNATQIRHIESSPGGPFVCFLPRKKNNNNSSNNNNNNNNKLTNHTKRKITTITSTTLESNNIDEPPQQREKITSNDTTITITNENNNNDDDKILNNTSTTPSLSTSPTSDNDSHNVEVINSSESD